MKGIFKVLAKLSIFKHKDCREISSLMLHKFKGINKVLFLRGNRNQLSCLILLNNRGEIWRQSLIANSDRLHHCVSLLNYRAVPLTVKDHQFTFLIG